MQHRKVIPVTVLKENDDVFSAYDCEFVKVLGNLLTFQKLIFVHLMN